MPFEVLAHLTAKALRSAEPRLVNFIWHGGEPLLLGRDFFRKALSLQQEFLQPRRYVLNSIQTNGTLIDDAWCEFLGRNKFMVGISVDGPEEIHNRNRSYDSGRGSFADVLRAIDLMRKHELSFGILVVLNENTKRLRAAEIFDFVLNDLGVDNFAFLPAVPDNVPGQATGERPADDYFSMNDYNEFMKQIFDHWFALDDPGVSVRELEGILRSVMGGNPGVCTLAGDCIGENYHIEPNGDVYHCDKYVGDPRYHVGNIVRDSFESIGRSPGHVGLVEDEKRKHGALTACPNYQVCHGGCPHDRYIAERYDPLFTGGCCGQSDLIDHIRAAVSRRTEPLQADVPLEVTAETGA
jgi:uncharacterized protein